MSANAREPRPGSGRPLSGRPASGKPGSTRPASAKKAPESSATATVDRVFDFSDGKSAKSLAEYILLIDTDLLPQVIEEADKDRRKVMVHAIRRKLTDLNAAIRSRLLAKDQTRRDILKLAETQYQHPAFTGDLIRKGGFEALLKHESAADEVVNEGVRRYLQMQDLEKKQLHETLDRRQNLEDSLAQAPYNRNTQRRGSVIDRMTLLEGIIKKQDTDINILQNQISEQNAKYVLLPKDDYLEIERKVQPYIVRRGNRATMANDLRNGVNNVVDQVQNLRGRVQQTSDTITDQERDKEVSLQLLQEENQSAEELREVIVRKVNEWQDEKENMKGEIKSLRNSISSLGVQNRSLMDALEKNQELENEKKESARARRISCPQPTPRMAEEGIKKAAEKRQRRVTVVGNTPKLSAVQLTLNGGIGAVQVKQSSSGMPVRRSSATTHKGPMRASGYP